MTRLFLRMIIAIIGIALPSRVEACMCMTSPTTAEAFADAHAVVVADVLEDSEAAGPLDRVGMWLRGKLARGADREDVVRFTFEWQIHIGRGRALRLHVIESFKGLPVGPATVFTASRETSCGWGLDVSRRYLIYLRVLSDPRARSHSYLITGDCMATDLVTSGDGEVEVLRGLAARKK